MMKTKGIWPPCRHSDVEITNGLLFVVAFLYTHRGSFVGGGFTILTAVGVILARRADRRRVAAERDKNFENLRDDIQRFGNGLKDD